MLYSVKGTVAASEPSLVVVETGGVGFAINTSLKSCGAVSVGQSALFYTHLYLREGIMDLYGFVSREELACFKLLIGVSGVGPKAAVAILGVCSPSQLALAVVAGDEKALTKAPGVGKKLALRILLDLKDKLAGMSEGDGFGLALPGELAQEGGDAYQDAVAALIVLGYSRAQAVTALKAVREDMGVDEMVRTALKQLF